ncbi:MAG: hypothetical protein E6600_12080 [Anaerocolumna aminovalerica]|uniref:hypothetical protein n=1 Tax=Anaerocolumna aminovalerica TaxID=1527 RepID=UPI002915518B|nr:hypothetical protein [Anaerocolumna aminovalerica]MDU6265227.1 hypothetical protein [Anaerocolumna aminovalerica]
MKKTEGKHFKKTFLAAAMLIGASTMIFQGFTQAAAMTENKKTNMVPTSYMNYTDYSSKTAQNNLPEGYKKANYTVGIIDLPYYKNQTPTEKDMSKEAAAELTAQYLWQVYGANLEGMTIEMGYNAPTDNTPRPMWTADVEMKDQGYIDGYRIDGYVVWIDSITGELYNIGLERTLKEKVPAAPDSSLNKKEYEAVAKELAEKYNIVHSPIQSIQCTGQGANFSTNTIGTYGDPVISFEVHGENGEVALMSISRYDKVLCGVVYNGQYKYDLLGIEKLEEEIREKYNEEKYNEPASADNKVPTLKGGQ